MPAPVLQFKRGNAGVAGTVPALRPGEPAISLNNFDFFIGIDTSVANNKFFGSHRYWGREDGTNSLRFKLVDKDGTNYVAIKSPDTLAGNITYILPGIQGAVSSVLTNDGSGNLTWASGSANPVFSGIATFTDTTDNTLGNANTGSVQIDGGVGINKNLTIGGNINVQGYSEFVGVVTFKGGTINIGDDTGDNISIGGEFTSGLYPNSTNTYDFGDSSRQWRNANFAGVGTFTTGVIADSVKIGITSPNTIDTSSDKLSLSSATGIVEVSTHLDVLGDLDVTGNVYIGGTTVTLRGTDVFIENKDIVLGYTTTTPANDTTANHAGVAIASTEGTPLVNFDASGINTLPSTYKQMMWFKSGTLGFSTDAFAFNYGVAIGTTTMANGIRLAVGTGVTIGDTSVSASNFYGAFTGNASSADQIKTINAGNTNANYYLTFVDANNGSATNETVYTDDGVYYNPGTNTFTTQYGYFTGNVTVDGNITGTASTATRAVTVDTTSTSTNAGYYVPFVDTLAGQTGETLRVGIGLSINPATGNVGVSSVLSVGSVNEINAYIKAGGGSNAMYLYSNGDVSFQAKVITNSIRSSSDSNNAISLSGVDATFGGNVKITGITTTATLKLNGTPGIGITGISASTTLTENSDDYLPTQKAVKAYVDAVDLTLGLNADSGGPSTVNTSQTLTISGTASEVNTSVSGQTITVGLPDDVIVGTSLSAPTIKTTTIQSSNTGATVLTLAADDASVAGDLTVGGNLYVNGNTTQVNTASITVEDRTIELGVVDGSAPSSSTTWDLGVLFNYYDSSAKKSALVWEQGNSRFKLGSVISDGGGTGNDNPQITFTSYAALEIGDLWINNSCTGGSTQVIGCVGSELQLQNITIDAGTF
jgi:hypothetical protein